MKTLLTLLLAACLAAPAFAQPSPSRGSTGDAANKAPSPPPPGSVDKSPRCLPQAVNECRSGCDTRRFEGLKPAELDRKRGECKQDCVRGC